MQIGIVTLFPELFEPFLRTSFVGRAITSGAIDVHLEQLREHGLGKHRSVDDTPYGGGSGMVMRPDCVVDAIESAERALAQATGSDAALQPTAEGDALSVAARATRVLLTPQGERLTHVLGRELSSHPKLVLVCGRYEGFDERVRSHVDYEVSIGDFVLTGGEVPAMALIEVCIRHVPGVLGNVDSPREESFSPAWDHLLEYPQYTRPIEFRGERVPEVLTSGDHGKIAAWRRERAIERTRVRRPDLLQARTELEPRGDEGS